MRDSDPHGDAYPHSNPNQYRRYAHRDAHGDLYGGDSDP